MCIWQQVIEKRSHGFERKQGGMCNGMERKKKEEMM